MGYPYALLVPLIVRVLGQKSISGGKVAEEEWSLVDISHRSMANRPILLPEDTSTTASFDTPATFNLSCPRRLVKSYFLYERLCFPVWS